MVETLTTTESVNPPSIDLPVILAVPFSTGIRLPSASTLTTLSLFELQIIFLNSGSPEIVYSIGDGAASARIFLFTSVISKPVQTLSLS